MRRRFFSGFAIVAPALLALLLCAPADAQNSVSVTVVPPLFQLTIGPGETWSTTLKIVNNNDVDTPYFAQVMDFAAQGEGGTGKFTPLVDESPDVRASSLAGWIQITSDPIVVPAHMSYNVPFTISIPQNADPGGHYAAILIGTHPTGDKANGAAVSVSSYVSSLIFVTIKGDIVEKGRIREFTSDKNLYQTPDVNFSLRFENTGNTHLLPRGNIVIYNMWGKQRGILGINDDNSNFGNVLPKSIRKFEFTWNGEQSPFDIGLYSAVATLDYGDQGKQNTSAVTYFWVVPIVPVASTLGAVVLFFILMGWFIKRYIRRALSIEKQKYGIVSPTPEVPTPSETMTKILMQPLKEGVIDLRSVGKIQDIPVHKPGTMVVAEETLTAARFITKYRIFFFFIAVVIVGILAGIWYWHKAAVQNRAFEISNVSIHEEASTQ